MTSRRIILLTICVIAILVIGSLTATILYYHHHPSALKTLIEKSVSASTGTSLTIGDLSYSISPLSVRAKGIILEPGKDQHGFYAAISDLKADMVIAGRLGHKKLIFTNLRVADFSLRLSSKMTLPVISSKPEIPPPLFSRVLKRVIRVLVFRGVTFEAGEAVDGDMVFESGDQIIEAREIQAKFSPEHRIEVFCSARAEWPQEEMRLTVPRVHVTSDHVISPDDQEIKGRLQVSEATFQSPQGSIRGIEIASTLIYDHNHEKLAFDPLDIRTEGITLRQGADGQSFATHLELEAKGSFDLQESEVNVSQFHLAAKDLLELKGALNMGFGAESIVRITRLDGHLLPKQCLSILHDTMGVRLPPVTLSGPVNLRGNVEGMKEQQAWDWQGDIEVLLSRNRYSYVTEQMRSTGRISGNLRATGSFPDMHLSVNLKGDETTFSGMGVTLKPFKARLSLSGKYPLHLIEEVRAEIPQANIATEAKDVEIRDIRVHAQKGSINAEKGLLSLPDVQLTSSLLKNLRLSLLIDEEQVVVDLK
ncbi:MAG: hypothetical protein JRF69_11095, partial [Deltaproteobacteria bacterium]|nr:hypothetical protein [Deltaproteobacteria bacterium]